MRPRGEAREALLGAAKRLTGLRQQAPLVGTKGELLIGATWLELMQFSGCGREITINTLKNMVRASEPDLEIVGAVREDHSDRPLAVYAPARPAPKGWLALSSAMTAMCAR